jgi:hypothetical protein
MKTRHWMLLALVLTHDVLAVGFLTWLAPPQVIAALSAIEHALMASSGECAPLPVDIHTNTTAPLVVPLSELYGLPKHQ